MGLLPSVPTLGSFDTMSTDSITIRDAAATDAPRVAALLGTLGYPTDSAAVARRLVALHATGADHVLVAERDGEVVAVGSMRVNPVLNADKPAAYLTALVVDDSTQGSGIGTRLLAAAESIAAARGCGRLTVSSAHHRADAHAFYLHRGYRSTGVRFAKDLTG